MKKINLQKLRQNQHCVQQKIFRKVGLKVVAKLSQS
jgi:hypothetical protein